MQLSLTACSQRQAPHVLSAAWKGAPAELRCVVFAGSRRPWAKVPVRFSNSTVAALLAIPLLFGGIYIGQCAPYLHRVQRHLSTHDIYDI